MGRGTPSDIQTVIRPSHLIHHPWLGVFRDVFGRFGRFCTLRDVSGRFGGVCGCFWTIWDVLGRYGTFWYILGCFRMFWDK